MTIQAHLEPRRLSHRRRSDVRMKLRLPTSGKLPTSRAADVTIQDISTGGMLIQTEAELAIGERIEVELPRTGGHVAVVVWSSGAFVGCRFEEPIPPAAVSAALLRSQPAPEPSAEGIAHQGDLAGRLSELRVAKGWSQEELADRLAVSRQAVWYWESGLRLPRAEHFRALAREFGVPERDLLAGPEVSVTPGVIEECRRRIASELGVPEGKVRISIEF